MKISNMAVDFVDSMGSDLSVVNAARVSFDKESEWEYKVVESTDEMDVLETQGWADVTDWDKDTCMFAQRLSEADQKLIKYLAKHNHWSPFSHTSVSLRIKAPIAVARQLAKHQVGGAWNEVSRRYVDSEPEFYFPDFRKRAANKKQGSTDELIDAQKTLGFDVLVENCLEQYQYLLSIGVCPEQARFILPQNTMTEWIWTGSLYFFSRVCNLRLDPHAQFEVQEVAKLISDVIRPLYPESWKVLVDDKQKA